MRTLLALALTTCLVTPTAAQMGKPKDVGDGGGDGGDASPLEVVVRTGDDVIDVEHNPRSGKVRDLRGRFSTQGSDLVSRTRDFLRSYGDSFGVAGDIDLGEPRRLPGPNLVVRIDQVVHDFDVEGHGLMVRFDERGDVVRAHGVIHDADGVEAPAISRSEAERRAFNQSSFARSELAGQPVIKQVARPTRAGLDLVYRVEIVDGLRPWALEVDAHTGALTRVVENTVHAGTFQYDGASTDFTTGTGRGYAYRKMSAATGGAERKSPLPHITHESVDEQIAVDGMLFGRYGYVADASGLTVFDPSRKFFLADDDPTLIAGQVPAYQLFDHVNTYYWVARMGAWFEKLLGPFVGAYPVLTYVNYDDEGAGYLNAFYSPADPDDDGGGFPPGYMLFGEFTVLTGDVMDDFSRDPSIVCHEYTHMVVDKEGMTFGAAPLDTPPRAVNEALADYAAAAALKHPEVGSAFVANATELVLEGTSLRDLGGDQTFARLWDQVGLETDLPAEHWAGGIFGAALWDVRRAIKKKTADPLILANLDAWPLSTAEVGYPVVDLDNAEAAYAAYFHACAQVLIDVADDGTTKGAKNSLRVLGAFMGRGIAGQTEDTIHGFDASEGPINLVVPSAFRDGVTTHAIDVTLEAGQTLTVVARGVAGTQVDFAFDEGAGTPDAPGDFSFPKPKKVNAAGTKVVQGKIGVNVSRTYRISTLNPGGAGGAYRLILKVK